MSDCNLNFLKIHYLLKIQMKKLTFPFIIFFFTLFSAFSSPDRNNNNRDQYEIATWKGFSQAVINFTFDDGCPNQFDVAIPMFDEYGFQLTIFLISNSVPEDKWEIIRQAVSKGHEMGSHTVSHPSLAELSVEDQREELSNSRKKIEENTGVKNCYTIAYPYCIHPDLELCSKYYIAGRDCRGEIEKTTPDSYYRISSIGCGDLSSYNTTEAFTDKMHEAASLNGWCVFLLHGIDNDGGYSPVTSQLLKECLDYLDKNRNKYWVTSLFNAVLYAKERDAAEITEKENSENHITIELTDNLDDSIYNHPLTIRRKMPDNWENISVRQRGMLSESKVIIEDNKKYVIFDAIPDKGEIVLNRN